MVRRAGFSFIELVVSIVVIGIVFMSVPLILVETQKSSAFSTQQEGIMVGVTSMVSILGYRWDEAETNRTRNGGFAKVCDVTGGDAELGRTTNVFGQETNRRRGHFKGEYRRKFYDPIFNDLLFFPNDQAVAQGYRPQNTYATYSSHLGLDPDDNGIYDDIDDFNSTASNLTGGGIRDYKFAYSISTRVYYIDDDYTYGGSNTMNVSISKQKTDDMTNIKMVENNVTSDEGSILFYAFSSNIGEYKILHRTFE
ncbi:prepilin-type N-terminal cleavage/methylation domain-containing protein [Hydrogenimonas sp. SS33]|uniref:prepilin-type N-terminal cleavage/methylation domain-containing protein n=1 Tax=Hydrogenimonas leucolamina TaxID=2954236 RepID=UPI00336BE7CE